MIEPLGNIRARISAIESLIRRIESTPTSSGARTAAPATQTASSLTFPSALESAERPATTTEQTRAAASAKRTVVGHQAATAMSTTAFPSRQPLVQLPTRIAAVMPRTTTSATTQDTTPAPAGPDPRWTDILSRDAAYLAAGAHGPTSTTDPNPLYTGTYTPEVEARRRADGSLNPNDLPSTEGLTADQLHQARLAESVPNAVLATGQNEGVARPGQAQNLNDSYDLLAWIEQLRSMQAGTIPPFVQENGYVWSPVDTQRNLDIAIDRAKQNKDLYNQRWQIRWAMLRADGLGAIADQEMATVKLVDPNGPLGSI